MAAVALATTRQSSLQQRHFPALFNAIKNQLKFIIIFL